MAKPLPSYTTTAKLKMVICGEEKKVKLMVVDLEIAPYFLESAVGNEGIIGYAAAAANKLCSRRS